LQVVDHGIKAVARGTIGVNQINNDEDTVDVYFWYFWLTIQNTTNRHVSNAFDLLAVFISFSGGTESLAVRPRIAWFLAAFFFVMGVHRPWCYPVLIKILSQISVTGDLKKAVCSHVRRGV